MLNYQTWLETPNVIRIALVQVTVLKNGISTVLYISTHPVTVDGKTYTPIIKGDITINESISTDYTASISYGDIELANNNGEYDSWLDYTNYIWTMKPINIYVGSMPQPGTTSVIGDFQQIFSGYINDLDSKSRFSLNIKIRDKLEKINAPVSVDLLGNYSKGAIEPDLTVYTNQYRNNLKPLCLGEVHNITPMLTDVNSGGTGSNEYMVSKDAVERIIEVRDNGIPVAFTQTPVTGTAVPAGSFRLLTSPVGTITCSVQGAKKTLNFANNTISSVYTNTASNIIALILTAYGQNIAASELDQNSFNTLGKQPVGIYLSDTTNVLSICQEIAKSCGLVLTITRLGQVKLIDLNIPTSAAVSITESDMFLNTLTLSQKIPVKAGVNLGYAKNYTIQTLLNSSIPQQFKDLFAQEYLESIKSDATVQANYNATAVPATESTYLITKADADTVSQKKLDLFKTPRKVITMTCVARLLSLQIGDAVKVTANRFNLSNGVFGLVVSTNPNWLKGTIDIGVLI